MPTPPVVNLCCLIEHFVLSHRTLRLFFNYNTHPGHIALSGLPSLSQTVLITVALQDAQHETHLEAAGAPETRLRPGWQATPPCLNSSELRWVKPSHTVVSATIASVTAGWSGLGRRPWHQHHPGLARVSWSAWFLFFCFVWKMKCHRNTSPLPSPWFCLLVLSDSAAHISLVGQPWPDWRRG